MLLEIVGLSGQRETSGGGVKHGKEVQKHFSMFMTLCQTKVEVSLQVDLTFFFLESRRKTLRVQTDGAGLGEGGAAAEHGRRI